MGAPEYFWQKVAKVSATGRTVSVDNVDGGPGAPSDAVGTGETDLDVEQSGALAPGANVTVYQAPNSDPGFIDAFFAAASQNIVGSVSTSWGESETYVASAVAAGQETASYEAAFDEAFLEMADQCQSVFAAAGDAGAYDASRYLGSTNLSVDTPGDSPYLTSSGGTTLPWSGTLTGPDGSATVTVPTQRAWGWDYLWQAIATTTGASTSYVVDGGGGFSVVEPEPAYQKLVSGTADYHGVQCLTPTDYQSVVSGTNFIEPTAWGRHPDPAGRLRQRLWPRGARPVREHRPGVGVGQPMFQSGWGGTSFVVSPQFNGSTAVIESYLGYRIGLWNPSVYSFAAGANSPVTPLNQAGTGNDNTFYTGNPGQLYNEATGLGVPNLAKFAADLTR